MQSCAVPIWPARINGAGFSIASAPSCHRRLWRPLQSSALAELNEGHARNSNVSCDGSLPSNAGFKNEAAPLATESEEFVSAAEIEHAALQLGLELQTEAVGPFFRVRVLNLQSKEVLGAAQGAVKAWTSGRILHLDSVRLSPSSLKGRKPIFGIGFLLGAAAVRYGYDQKCNKAELLAIKDTDTYHSKLVRYYSRMGFRTVYDVTGESLQDIPHMLIWGGVGTRMDVSVEELLRKWSPAFKKLSKAVCTGVN